MRAHNERLVLSLLRQTGPMAKAEIARASGLSAQTISVIMRALESDGLLERGDPVRGKVGQPSVPMHLAGSGAYAFGLKVGRRSTDLIAINFLGEVIGRVRQTYAYPTPDAVTGFATRAYAELVQAVPAAGRSRIAGLGVAIPFQLWNWAEPIGAPSCEMEPWRTRDIRRELADTLGLEVFVRNDATAACGAELVFGPQNTARDFIHFYVGYFIGGGLVLNGSLHTGRTGNAAALGSIPLAIEAGGRTTQLFDVASLSVLETRLKAQGHPTESLWQDPDAWSVAPDILKDWIEQAGSALAFAIASAASVVEAEAVLIDGWMPGDVRARLVAQTRTVLAGLSLSGIDIPDVREGTIGADARALGAASLPLSERYLVDLNALMKAG